MFLKTKMKDNYASGITVISTQSSNLVLCRRVDISKTSILSLSIYGSHFHSCEDSGPSPRQKENPELVYY